MKLCTATLATALLLAAAACGPAGQSDTKAPAAEDAATPAAAAAPAADASPFSADEQRMKEHMMAAVGSDAQHTWALKMLEHHRGAVAMTRTYLSRAQDPQLRQMAEKSMAMQQKDIQELEAWLRDHPNARAGGADANPYMQAEQAMHQRMMVASGANADQMFARKMREHHQGGVRMTEIGLPQFEEAKLKSMAQKTMEAQRKEAGELDRWISEHAAG